MRSFVYRSILSVVLVLLPVASATATVILDAGPKAVVYSLVGEDFVVGTEFRVDSEIRVNGLGFIDIGNNGLASEHPVGLWTATGQLLRDAIVNNASRVIASGNNAGRWLVETITPLTLVPGLYRIAGLVTQDDLQYFYDDLVANGVTPSGYVRNNPQDGFGFPDVPPAPELAVILVTLTSEQFVPEPGTTALLGIGLFAAVALGRRRRS